MAGLRLEYTLCNWLWSFLFVFVITSKRDKLKERKHNQGSVVGKGMDANAHLFLTYKVTPRSVLEEKTLALPNVGYIHKDSKDKTSALQTK